MLDALEAVHAAGIGTRDDFYWTLHSVFVKRHEQSFLFDQAFRIFFKRRDYLDQLMAMTMPQAPAPVPDRSQTRRRNACRRRCSPGLKDRLQREERKTRDRHAPHRVRQEVLQKKDFAQMSAAEIAAAKQAIQRLVLPLDDVKTRRLAPHRHGHIIDMRRTLRASMKGGGDFIDLKYLGPKTKAAADRRACSIFPAR